MRVTGMSDGRLTAITVISAVCHAVVCAEDVTRLFILEEIGKQFLGLLYNPIDYTYVLHILLRTS